MQMRRRLCHGAGARSGRPRRAGRHRGGLGAPGATADGRSCPTRWRPSSDPDAGSGRRRDVTSASGWRPSLGTSRMGPGSNRRRHRDQASSLPRAWMPATGKLASEDVPTKSPLMRARSATYIRFGRPRGLPSARSSSVPGRTNRVPRLNAGGVARSPPFAAEAVGNRLDPGRCRSGHRAQVQPSEPVLLTHMRSEGSLV